MIAYFGRTKWCVIFDHCTTHAGSFCNQRNDPNSQKQGFGHFLEFCASVWFDIAYFDRTKWCAPFAHPITVV